MGPQPEGAARPSMIRRIALAVALFAGAARWVSAVSVTTRAAAATPSRYATQAAVQILTRGGTAADAAIGAALVLGVVQPQRAGLGGGATLLYFEKSTGAVWALDAREVSPLSLDDKSVFAKFSTAGARRDGILSICVPSFARAAFETHKRFGKMSWADLFVPAIALARDGFEVDDALNSTLAAAQHERKLDANPAVAKIFFPGGKPLAPGAKLVQADLALVLEKTAHNVGDFYDGALTKRLVAYLHTAGSPIGFRDFRDLAVVWRAPLNVEYGEFSVYAAPPPSTGGIALADQLSMVNALALGAPKSDDPKSAHLFSEIERRALADVVAVGDPEVNRLPLRELFSEERAKEMRASISPDRATPSPNTGVSHDSRDAAQIVVVDANGNAATIIVSLGDPFGSGVLAEGLGFFLNDAMGDFSSLAAGSSAKKRAPYPFSPAIVLRGGAPYLVIASCAGDASARLTLEVILAVSAGKSLESAIDAPRFHQRVAPDEIVYENSKTTPEFAQKLNDAGHASWPALTFGDVQAILCDKKMLTAVSDSRQGGATGGY